MSGADRGGNGESNGPALIVPPLVPILRPSLPLKKTKPTPTPSPQKPVVWNTSHLGLRLTADLSAAASASVLVSPIICIIDQYNAPPTYLPYLKLTSPLEDDNQESRLLFPPTPYPPLQYGNLTPKPSDIPRLPPLPPHLRPLHLHLCDRQLR
jgi:hypothetical protein